MMESDFSAYQLDGKVAQRTIFHPMAWAALDEAWTLVGPRGSAAQALAKSAAMRVVFERRDHAGNRRQYRLRLHIWLWHGAQ